MKLAAKFALALSGYIGQCHATDSSLVVAALKDADIVLIDPTGNATRISNDARPKWALRWLPDGTRISYLVPPLNPDKVSQSWRMEWPRLVISDLKGQIVSEIPLRPAEDSANPESIRAIETVEWISDTIVRFEGSFGPRNCAAFDVDFDSGRTLGEHDAECGSLTASPDGKHIAYLFPVSMGTWDDRLHRLEIDDSPALSAKGSRGRGTKVRTSVDDAPVSYAGAPGDPIHLEAGPVWSADSQWVAVLERRVSAEVGRGEVPSQPQMGPISLTTISIRGEVRKAPVPSSAKDDPMLTWISGRVAIGHDSKGIVVDPASGTYAPVDVDSAAVLRDASDARQKVRECRDDVNRVLKVLGAREGVAKPN